jgi:hypothetical protein
MKPEDFKKADDDLSRRQRQVVRLFLQDKSDAKIAKELGVKEQTVRKHIANICDLFELKEENEKKGTKHRHELKEAYADYIPEMVSKEFLKEYKLYDDVSLEKIKINNNDEIYLERELLDSCREKLSQVGMLLRIKAPQQWGKTLLVNRLLEKMEQQGYQTAYIDVLDADKDICENLDRLLQWFCRNVGRELGVAKEKLRELWDELDGSKVNAEEYFDKAILPEIDKGLVLALDNIECIFPCPTAEDFLSMLRAWFEKTKRNNKWSNLRLIVAHSTECYVQMNKDHSPFNVGVPIGLSEFNFEQVKELVKRQGVSLDDGEIKRLIENIGGHPFLVDRAIASLKDNPGSLDDLLGKAATLEGIYGPHLRELWGYIQERSELVTAMKNIVNGTEGADLKNPPLAHQLESLGAVKLDGNKVVPRCNLYREFFREQLVDNS